MSIFLLLAARRHQKMMKDMRQKDLKRKMLETVGAFTLICGAHTGAMMKFEKMPVNDALWLTATTTTTVGYGDLSAKTTEGRLATVILLYGGGILLFAQAASALISFGLSRKEQLLKGKWRWKMEDHIVILNAPANNAEAFFKQMIGELRKSDLPAAKKPILIATFSS